LLLFWTFCYLRPPYAARDKPHSVADALEKRTPKP